MLQQYCVSLTQRHRLPTLRVPIGDLAIGGGLPILNQTMTTTDTMDTVATVAQVIRCIEAGAHMVRITAPSRREAENLLEIKKKVRAAGFNTPLIADIHYTPNAAEVAARIVEKVRVNPGNYVDKKHFDILEYSDAEYQAEIERIAARFLPLVRICKENCTAMRIGVNHGSLSDRIMSRYGDTPLGMVESALEFLRIARSEGFHQIVLSMKSSNPQVMVQAYRLLISHMFDAFGECYPLHLGVTEAGDGDDGRIKSAIGIGSLLADGIGDTIRVSLTEDPEREIPVCNELISRFDLPDTASTASQPIRLPYNPFGYVRRHTLPVGNIGGHHVPVVIASLETLSLGSNSATRGLQSELLPVFGYNYVAQDDKWHLSDLAADYLYLGDEEADSVPPAAHTIINYEKWKQLPRAANCHPLFTAEQFLASGPIERLHFISLDLANFDSNIFSVLANDSAAVLLLHAIGPHALQQNRSFISELMLRHILCPVVLACHTSGRKSDQQLIDYSVDTGALLLDGMGDGIFLRPESADADNLRLANNAAFGILQATRTRISKTEYISCPSCGRTLFDLQETTARIRSATSQLKGVKIAIMGCIVNGPGEMADADFGYVGSGPGKITLYKGKEIVRRAIPAETAVQELIALLKQEGVWVEPTLHV